MSVPSELRARALELPEADRAALAHDLILSLEPEGQGPDPGHEEAWAAEIEARSREVHEGRAVLLTREEFEARIQCTVERVRKAAGGHSDG